MFFSAVSAISAVEAWGWYAGDENPGPLTMKDRVHNPK